MATTFRPTPAFTFVYAVTTAAVTAMVVTSVNLLIDLVIGANDVLGALLIGAGIGLMFGAYTAISLRGRSLTLVPGGIVLVKDRVRITLLWRDFEEVRTLGLFKRDELVFRKGELTQADKQIPQRVLDRMHKIGADRTVVVSDFFSDWKSTELHTEVKRTGRG
ncbi:hypothetical protein ACTG9Q_09880 [Actinokineospora sp. 24-640]